MREHASEKAISNIQKISLERTTGSYRPLLVVLGCYSEYVKKRVEKRLPGVDIIIGTHNLESLPELIKKNLETHRKLIAFSETPPGPFDEKGFLRTPGVTAYLPITYGCNNFCSYCVVPYTTGRQRSRPLPSLIDELQLIVEEGFREIMLLGQNVNSYGMDLDGGLTFEGLLQIIEHTMGNEKLWIRFLTSHPRDMNRSIIERVKGSSILCPYFHLPLQSGSDTILHSMNRGYTQEHYLNMVSQIREIIPEAGIGTDLIVGYPGETKNDFQETLRVAEAAQFDIAYTYCYSHRPNTQASLMNDEIPITIKKERLRILNEMMHIIHSHKMNRLLGQGTTVLIDEKTSLSFSGKTPSNLRVSLPPQSILNPGQFVPVQLTSIQAGKLWGEVIERES
ncbi:MAG: MiaB/RimO family radical SAM methylthiotransferase [Atribacterota bacterium]